MISFRKVLNLRDGTRLTSSIDDEYGNSDSDVANYTFDPVIPPIVWTTPMNDGYRKTALVANPRQVRDFGRATGQLAKTDRIEFAERVRPE